MTNKNILFDNLISLINKYDKIELHIFNEFITKNSIYFYQFISKIKNNKIILKKIIDMLNINYDFFIQTIDVIESTFKMNNHKVDYSHEYYLIIILQLLNNHNQWVSLKLNILANNHNKYHYKTIHKKFILYSNKNIFNNSFYKTTTDNEFISNNSDLLIDASMIANKTGSENVSVNCEYTKKNCTKLSFIANTDKIILSVTPYDINNKEINYDEIKEIKKQKQQKKLEKKNQIKILKEENKKLKKMLKQINIKNDLKNDIKNNTDDDIKNKNEINCNTANEIKDSIKNKINNKNKIIKTSIHDVMMIQTSINNIKTKFTNINGITLSGDLGYLTSTHHHINNNKILLITPKRKNQIIKNTNIESIKLKSRYKIENCFGIIKQYERIILRKDRQMKTFMSFIYIACAIENLKILKKTKYNH